MPTAEDVFEALRAHLEDTERPIATAPEVAERVAQSRRKTLEDLRVLERAGDDVARSQLKTTGGADA